MSIAGTHPTESHTAPVTRYRYALAIAVVAGLFAIWGLGQWLYAVLFPQFAQFYALSPTQITWTQALFNIAYCGLAVPAALSHRRFGYKLGVIFALSMFSIGPFLLYPAITRHEYPFFLYAVVFMGAAWAWLETSLNPLVVELGPRQTAVWRLNLVQAFYPVGLLVGTYVALWLLSTNYRLSVGELAPAIARPYVLVGLGVLLLAFLIENAGFPAAATDRAGKTASMRGEFRTLLAQPEFRFAMAALFCNIMAQSATWGSTFSYVMQEIAHATPAEAGEKITWSCIVLAVGRFAGTLLMRRIEPVRLLKWYTVLSLVLIVPAIGLGGLVGLVCLMATSFFMAIMYPTVFGTAIRDTGSLTKTASGLLVTAAGLAAALSPFVITFALGHVGARTVLVLTVPCFLIILFAALRWMRQQPVPAAAVEG